MLDRPLIDIREATAPAGDRVPCHLCMPGVEWPEAPGEVLRPDCGAYLERFRAEWEAMRRRLAAAPAPAPAPMEDTFFMTEDEARRRLERITRWTMRIGLVLIVLALIIGSIASALINGPSLWEFAGVALGISILPDTK